ncbi:MAG TPA: class II aldolase/adducin family protein, partial [Sphaerochaeta sp.]|nr:class II aldolase/adducin family protein [Sphaerochaeta sp.]
MHQELQEIVYEANMALKRNGLITLTWGNVSMVDAKREVMAIKPSGVPYESLRPSDIVLLNL